MRNDEKTERWVKNLVEHCIGMFNLEEYQKLADEGKLTKEALRDKSGGTVHIHTKAMSPEKLGQICSYGLGSDYIPEAGNFLFTTPWGEMLDSEMRDYYSGRNNLRTMARAVILALAYDYFYQKKYWSEQTGRKLPAPRFTQQLGRSKRRR